MIVIARVPTRGALALLSIALLVGCASAPMFPIAQNRPYTGPPVSVDSSGDEHVAIITAPTGGWQARYDGQRKRFGGRRVFVTLVTPDPTRAHTQAQVKHHVATPVAASTPIDVYVRALEFDPTLGSAPTAGNPLDWLINRLTRGEDSPSYRLAHSTESD